MASQCCFQQTVYHYSVWQESKHCAFTGQEKATPPPPSTVFVKSLHPASLCCFVFSLIFTLPLVSHYVAPLCSSLRGHQQHRRGGAMFNTRAREQCQSFSSSDGGRIPVSVSSSSLSGSPAMCSFNKKKVQHVFIKLTKKGEIIQSVCFAAAASLSRGPVAVSEVAL